MPRYEFDPEKRITFADRPPEERHRIAQKGAEASAKVRREKKNIRNLAETLLNMDVSTSQKTIRKRMQALGLAEEDMIYANAILTAMLVKATNGDVNAAKFVRDTAGFVPEENINMAAEVSEKSDVLIYLPELERDDDDDETADGERG